MRLEPHGNVIKDYEEWVRAFLRSKEAKGLSENTLNAYSRILEEFKEILLEYQDEMSFGNVTKMTIDLYLARLRAKGLSPSTLKGHIVVLKNFFVFVTENNEDLKDFTKIFDKIKVKLEKKTRPVLTEEEAQRLIDYVENLFDSEPSLKRCRNSLLVKLLLETGMRSHSLLSLRFSDMEQVEYEGETFWRIKILQKGKKENVLYVRADIIDGEMEYCLERLGKEAHVAFGRNGAITRRQLHNLLQTLYKKVGINKSGVHILRHTFVYLKRLQGVDLSTIQALLGHSSITTTINVYGSAKESDKIMAASKPIGSKTKKG